MIWLSHRYPDSELLRIDEPDGITEFCLASQSHTPRTNAFSSFVAGRRFGDFRHSSPVRTHAQSCPQIESPRARVPYIAGCENSPSTVPRPAALQSQGTRSLVAYGAAKLRAKTCAPIQPIEGIRRMTRQCERRFSWSCCTTPRPDAIDQHRASPEWHIKQHQYPPAPSLSGSAIQWSTTLLDPPRPQSNLENRITTFWHFCENYAP